MSRGYTNNTSEGIMSISNDIKSKLEKALRTTLLKSDTGALQAARMLYRLPHLLRSQGTPDGRCGHCVVNLAPKKAIYSYFAAAQDSAVPTAAAGFAPSSFEPRYGPQMDLDCRPSQLPGLAPLAALSTQGMSDFATVRVRVEGQVEAEQNP